MRTVMPAYLAPPSVLDARLAAIRDAAVAIKAQNFGTSGFHRLPEPIDVAVADALADAKNNPV